MPTIEIVSLKATRLEIIQAEFKILNDLKDFWNERPKWIEREYFV